MWPGGTAWAAASSLAGVDGAPFAGALPTAAHVRFANALLLPEYLTDPTLASAGNRAVLQARPIKLEDDRGIDDEHVAVLPAVMEARQQILARLYAFQRLSASLSIRLTFHCFSGSSRRAFRRFFCPPRLIST